MPEPAATRSPAVNRPAAARPAASRPVQSPALRGRAREKAAQPAAFRLPLLGRLLRAVGRAPGAARRGKKPAPAPAPAGESLMPDVAPPPPGEKLPRAPRKPSEDPLFQSARVEVRTESRRQRRHPLPDAKREEAVKASALRESEQIEQSSKEKSTQEMKDLGAKQQADADRFSAKKFKDDLKSRVDKKAPHDEREAKDLAKQPPLENFEQQFAGDVAQEQGKVIGPLEEKAKQPPSGGKAEKPEAAVPKAAPPPVPKPVDPRLAAPKPKAWWEISLQRESDRLDGMMRENRLSDQQLADSREPSFIRTLEAKQQAQKKVAEAPQVYRQREAAVLTVAQARAGQSLAAGLQGMSAIKGRTGGQVYGGQTKSETRTETRQREIKGKIDGFYNDTVKEVKEKLEEMANAVKGTFAEALKAATENFNNEVRRRISDYYGDWRIDDDLFGPADVIVEKDGSTRAMTWEEKFSNTPRINPDVYRIFVQEKDKFLAAMDTALDQIATNVETGLKAAHDRIKKGESDIAEFKDTLSGDERTYADELEKEVKLKFETLEASIDDTREDLLSTLADQYSESVNQLEKTFNEINDELKKGWLERAAEFIKTVGKTIFDLASLLLSILSRMAGLIWDIVRHPIRFFETLVDGLALAIREFVGNIGTYMQEAFWTWITKTSSAKGITLSAGSGVESLFGVVLQVLALTPADLRASAEKILGREIMELFDKGKLLAEKAAEPVTILLTKGPGALWEHIKESLASTVQSSFDRIRQSVFNTFIEKALKWVAGFFIPGGGFVKVVKAVFRAFQFVVDNLERIKHFFNSIFDSMEAATQGKTQAVASRIITGLKLGIVMALDFLAKQIGAGPIVDTVQKIIQALRRPIVAAVEWLLNKVKPFVQKLVAKGQELVAKALGGDPKATSEERVERGLVEGVAVVNRYAGRPVGALVLRPLLVPIKLRHRLRVLDVIAHGDTWFVDAAASPGRTRGTSAKVARTASRTKVDYKPGAPDAKSTEVFAYPLTYLQGASAYEKGSDANRSTERFPRAWFHVANEAAPKQPWRRMHLLSAALHGPGNIESNIVPAVERVNSGMRDGPEEWGKTEIVKKKEKVGWYRVKVAYDHPAPYTEFPSSVSVQGGFCTVDQNDDTKVTRGPAESGASFSRTNLGLPNALGATATGPRSIQASSADALFTAFKDDGMTQLLAQWLARQPPFSSAKAVKDAMRASVEGRISDQAKIDVVDGLMKGPNPRLVP